MEQKMRLLELKEVEPSYFLFNVPQWISLLYRRVQKIEQIQSDHCDRSQNNCTKNAIEWHCSPTSEMVGTLVKFH